MKSNKTLLLTTIIAFAGGFAAGASFQSDAGRRVRGSVGASAREHTRWLEEKLHALEKQVAALEGQAQQRSEELGQRLRDTVQQYVPHLDVDEEEWEVRNREVERDLPRMPRS